MKPQRPMLTMCLTLALVLLAGLVLTAACSGTATGPGTSQAPAAQEQLQKDLVIGAGTGATSLVYGTTLAGMITKYTPIQATVRQGSGMVHYPLVNSGEVHVLPYNLALPLFAYNGEGLEKTRLRDLTGAAAPSLTALAVIARPETGIKTIKDLRGRIVDCEHPVIPYYAPIMDALLKANGMTRKDLTWIVLSTAAEATNAMKEKRIEAAIVVLGSSTQEIKDSVGMTVIAFTPQEQAAVASVSSFVPWTTPPNFYGAVERTPVCADPSHIIVGAAMNSTTAYTIIKAFYEHIGDWHAVSPTFTGFTLQNALSHMVIPFHPGAIKFYREAGLWKDEHTKKQRELIEKERSLYGNVSDEAAFKAMGILP